MEELEEMHGGGRGGERGDKYMRWRCMGEVEEIIREGKRDCYSRWNRRRCIVEAGGDDIDEVDKNGGGEDKEEMEEMNGV